MNNDIMQRLVSGYCPKHNEKRSIRVDYREVDMCGDPVTHYVKTGYCCEEQAFENCGFEPYPIFKKLSSSI
ncbi:hypothetical protein [Clostridium sp. JS66]|uniref:hypothetical protein n=1 Tax=Clostridium sp. JS66 TaxID=3064705 RepID=UPI00298E6941|nr:hypothetical protein [Clostridium sp. JS66]WPC41210.1 hypothetical protein Q6H37_25475 [Clostridium sp. JS66]